MATKLFDVIISDSDHMAEIYKKEFRTDCVVIAYGENLSASQNPELLKSFNLRQGEYYLVVGRLIPDNNASLIVQGFKQSATKRKLVIVGDVPYKDVYAEALKRTRDQRVVFTGYVRDADMLRELYCNSYAYIHGHEFGGTNPTLLKALACGCCILALDTFFNREVLNHDEYGIFFQKDPKEIARLIERVDNDKSIVDVFRSKARKRITERYTWDRITDQYEKLFKEMDKVRPGKDAGQK